MFEYLEHLYDSKLYSSVIEISSVIIAEYNVDLSRLSACQYFQTLCYFGGSLHKEFFYQKAENILRKALCIRTQLVMEQSSTDEVYHKVDCFPEVEIRYKLALCYEATTRIDDAVSILQEIHMTDRPAKVSPECQLNFEAIRGLISLDVDANEINSCVGDNLSPLVKHWLNNFIDSISKMKSFQFLAAIESLKKIGSSEIVLVLIGQCYHYLGNSEDALIYLSRAYRMNSALIDGALPFIAVFANLNRFDDLLEILPLTSSTNESTPEYWFILAQKLYYEDELKKALYFAEKSIELKPKNIEAELLKIKILINSKVYQEALTNLCSIQEYAPYRFEIYELLLEVYLYTRRLHEARQISIRLCNQEGIHLVASYYVLSAKIYLHRKDPDVIEAKLLLERALRKDPSCCYAIISMACLLLRLKETMAAIQLLENQCANKPGATFYVLLGDIYKGIKKYRNSNENYTLAIQIDSLNQRAHDGLKGLKKLLQPESMKQL